MYAAGDYDLAGFCVGVVESSEALDGSAVRPGDALLAIASSGPHANGYSLIRKVIERSGAKLDNALEAGGPSLADLLLEPTQLYCRALLDLRRRVGLHAAAHITGGGISENLPRVLPEDCAAQIDLHSWEWPAVFRWLQDEGAIDRAEMLRTFNCGVGMIAVVDAAAAEQAIACLAEHELHAWRIGTVVDGRPSVTYAE
jgi:phosphoribosylformylglycinamidine cyclo-ligase